ncbi:hypothetical protein BDW74DRAFT_174804 [Aspergillus multicolor]|uniref:uncharacterized protein n=1 Tax=Aspergillus multicolor TaxID=41759 RepID=UPI003CCCAB8C
MLVLSENYAISPDTPALVRRIDIPIITIGAAFTLWSYILCWKLYGEFSWVVFRRVKADVDMLRRYLHLLVLFISLLKSGFYFLGLLAQLASVSVYQREMLIAVATLIPGTCFLLVSSASTVRHEKPLGTVIAISVHTALLAFFIYTFTRMNDPATANDYGTQRQTLMFFGIMAMLLSVGMIDMACWCFRNFRHGLKPYVSGDRKAVGLGDTFELEIRQ